MKKYHIVTLSLLCAMIGSQLIAVTKTQVQATKATAQATIAGAKAIVQATKAGAKATAQAKKTTAQSTIAGTIKQHQGFITNNTATPANIVTLTFYDKNKNKLHLVFANNGCTTPGQLDISASMKIPLRAAFVEGYYVSSTENHVKIHVLKMVPIRSELSYSLIDPKSNKDPKAQWSLIKIGVDHAAQEVVATAKTDMTCVSRLGLGQKCGEQVQCQAGLTCKTSSGSQCNDSSCNGTCQCNSIGKLGQYCPCVQNSECVQSYDCIDGICQIQQS
jgi:hypothetical protein